MSNEVILNGVDTNVVNELIEEVKAQPDLAKCNFRLTNKWMGGGHTHSTVKDFYGAKQTISHLKTYELDTDEPPILAGRDIGPNPVEHLLNALAGCLTATLVYHAAVRGIEIEELESELDGDIDLRGFFGLSNDVSKGFENIKVKFKVKTADENLEKLRALSKLSPVFDTTSNGTNVDVQIEGK